MQASGQSCPIEAIDNNGLTCWSFLRKPKARRKWEFPWARKGRDFPKVLNLRQIEYYGLVGEPY